MAEQSTSRLFMSRLRRYGRFTRIENVAGVGTPDVAYTLRGASGWVENKWRASWPRSPGAVVTLDHYTPGQRIFARDEIRAGGRVFVFLEIERPVPSYFLLWGEWARRRLGTDATRADVETAAIVASVGAFPLDALIVALTTEAKFWR
jgi:hypothetical protein